MRFFIEGVGRHCKRVKSKNLNIGKAQSFLFIFREMEVKINLSRFRKLAEYKQGEFQMLMPHEHYHAKHYGVYLIVFDEGENFYVGTSCHLRRRILQHWWGMKGKYHKFPLVQNAFDKCNSFEVYALSEGGIGAWEDDFIFVLRPPLNIACTKSYLHLDDLKAVSSYLGFSLSCLLDEERIIKFVKDEASEKETYIICPHCGERIKLSVEK